MCALWALLTRETYQILLMRHAQEANMDGAIDIMATMQTKGYPLTPAVIRAVILCYGEQG